MGKIGEVTTVEAVAADPVTMAIAVGGSANIYTWVRGEDEVVGSAETYTITAVTAEDAGKYRLSLRMSLTSYWMNFADNRVKSS